VKTIPAAKFKAQCLALLDRVTPEDIVITKHGKPVARLVAIDAEPGALVGSLNTHILLHALAGELSPREAGLLRKQPWSISAIVIWEIGKLAELGRIELDLDDIELTRNARSFSRLAAHTGDLPGDSDVGRSWRSRRRDHRGDQPVHGVCW
jgi:prevent-host-death family protein